MSKVVSVRRILDAIDEMQGWCTECKAFTRPDTEPDATGYHCPDCGEDSVIGAEELAQRQEGV